jgi:hypothetical protein
MTLAKTPRSPGAEVQFWNSEFPELRTQKLRNLHSALGDLGVLARNLPESG